MPGCNQVAARVPGNGTDRRDRKDTVAELPIGPVLPANGQKTMQSAPGNENARGENLGIGFVFLRRMKSFFRAGSASPAHFVQLLAPSAMERPVLSSQETPKRARRIAARALAYRKARGEIRAHCPLQVLKITQGQPSKSAGYNRPG